MVRVGTVNESTGEAGAEWLLLLLLGVVVMLPLLVWRWLL